MMTASINDQIPMEQLEVFTKEVKEKFGEQALWASLFLLLQINSDSWTFPDYVMNSPMQEMAKFIETNKAIRSVFGKGENSNGQLLQ